MGIPRSDLTKKKNKVCPEFSLSFPEFFPKKWISVFYWFSLVFWPSSIQEKQSNATNVLHTLRQDVATPLMVIFQRIVQLILLKKSTFAGKSSKMFEVMCKSFVAVDMKNIKIWLVKKKTNTPPFWRNTILLSLPASMMGAMAHPQSRFQ